MFSLVFDDREHKLHSHLGRLDYPYQIKRILYGDIHIFIKEKLFCIIERKTWSDLASSLKDGRKRNTEGLLELRNNHNCKIIFIIEGEIFPKYNSSVCKIPIKQLIAYLDHLTLRDNIPIYYSTSPAKTVQRINYLIKNATTLDWGDLSQFTGGEDSVLKREINEDNYIRDFWCQIPYITINNYKLFINETSNFTMCDLFSNKISYNDLEIISKRENIIITEKYYNKIFKITKYKKYSTQKKYIIRLLSFIKGVTKKVAEKILEEKIFEKIIHNEITVEELAKFKKTEKTILGNKMAQKIIDLFNNNIFHK